MAEYWPPAFVHTDIHIVSNTQKIDLQQVRSWGLRRGVHTKREWADHSLLFILIRIFLNSGKYCERQRREPLGVSRCNSVLPHKILKSRILEMLFSVVSTWIFQTRSSLKEQVVLVITTIFPFDSEHSYIVIHTGYLHETFYKTRRVLQGISEQKLKPPGPRGALYSYLKCMIASEESLLSPMVHLM